MAETQKTRIETMADTPDSIESVRTLLVEKRAREKELAKDMQVLSEERRSVRNEIIFLEEKAAQLLGMTSTRRTALPEGPTIPRKDTGPKPK